VPEAKNAMLGSIAPDDPRFAAMAAEGARTIPGRENGGNCDIKVRRRAGCAGARARQRRRRGPESPETHTPAHAQPAPPRT